MNRTEVGPTGRARAIKNLQPCATCGKTDCLHPRITDYQIVVCQTCGKNMQATEERQNYFCIAFQEGTSEIEFVKSECGDDCGWRFYCEDDHKATPYQVKVFYEAIANGARIV